MAASLCARLSLSLSACAKPAIDDADSVPDTPRRLLGVREAAHFASFHPHAYLIRGRSAAVLFDLVPGVTTANRAGYGRDLAAAAAADLITQDAAEHCARYHADTAWCSGLLDRLY